MISTAMLIWLVRFRNYDHILRSEDFEDNDNINDSLSPGRTITFTTFYAVPKKAKDIQLEYEPSFWSDEKLIIQVK